MILQTALPEKILSFLRRHLSGLFFSGNVKKKNGDLKQVEKHCFQFSARTGSGLISDEVSGEFSFPGNENEDYSASSGNCFAGNAQTGSCGARASPLLKFT